MFASVKSLVVLGCLAASAFAQNIAFGAPAVGASVSPGENITVEVNKPDSLTGSTEVGLAITLKSCGDTECGNIDVTEILGSVLYTGPYNPVFTNWSWYPTENFTVQVPTSFSSGDAILSATHFSLVGAGPFPYLETVNITITVS